MTVMRSPLLDAEEGRYTSDLSLPRAAPVNDVVLGDRGQEVDQPPAVTYRLPIRIG
jgi:hypothetical protein